MVFDVPTSKGTYSERYSQLCASSPLLFSSRFLSPSSLFLSQGDAFQGKQHPFISIAPYEVCKGTDHLETIIQDIMDQGGEGIILRDPSSAYQSGRSSGYLKHKVLCSPTEMTHTLSPPQTQ